MGYRRRRQCESQIYHVMARGVGRMLLFEDDADRSRYLSFLDDALSRHDLDVLAWCLMDNHIHLLVRGQLERVAKVMQLAGRSYALYFNRRHDHVGHLFQGRYASKPIEGNEHLLTVVRYIHQNPIESGASENCHYPGAAMVPTWGSLTVRQGASTRRRSLGFWGARPSFVGSTSCLGARLRRRRAIVQRRR